MLKAADRMSMTEWRKVKNSEEITMDTFKKLEIDSVMRFPSFTL